MRFENAVIRSRARNSVDSSRQNVCPTLNVVHILLRDVMGLTCNYPLHCHLSIHPILSRNFKSIYVS